MSNGEYIPQKGDIICGDNDNEYKVDSFTSKMIYTTCIENIFGKYIGTNHEFNIKNIEGFVRDGYVKILKHYISQEQLTMFPEVI